MYRFLLSVSFAALASAIPCPDKPPVWPDAYVVQGTLNVPSAELETPLHAWYDAKLGNSRVDLYDGTSRLYQMEFFPQGKGSTTLIVPVTTETYVNKPTCVQTIGSGNVRPHSVLPDMTGYKCVGHGTVNAMPAQKWTAQLKVGDVTNHYTTWVQWKKPEGSKEYVPTPVYFEVKGTERYSVSFFSYTIKTPDKTIWDEPQYKTTINCLAKSLESPDSTPGVPIRPHEVHAHFAWHIFLNAHGKAYNDTLEHDMRKDIFKNNFHLVHTHNIGNHNYRLALNRFADWTENELKTLRGKMKTSGVSEGSSPFPLHGRELEDAAQALPPNFDWRLYGAVTPVKNQYNCGSCWSFSATGTIEGAYYLKTNKLLRLSEQALIDCSWGFGNAGCDGGLESYSYQWIMKHGGLPLEDDYPYKSIDGYCHVNSTQLYANITGWVNVPSHDETTLKVAIFKYGPVSVNIYAATATFPLYSSGVYDDPSCKQGAGDLDHGVLAVGFGVFKGQTYWLIKNSYSNWWGDDGYILMSTKNNICGVTTAPSYVTM